MGDEPLDDVLSVDTRNDRAEPVVDETVLNFSTQQRVSRIVDDVIEEVAKDGLTEDAKATREIEKSDLMQLLAKERVASTRDDPPTEPVVQVDRDQIQTKPLNPVLDDLEPAGLSIEAKMAIGAGAITVGVVLLYVLL